MSDGDSGGKVEPLSVVTTSAAPGHVTITVSGDLDLVTTEFLRAELGQALDPLPSSVVVDLNAVDFCDSTGLSTLIGFNKRCVADRVPLQFRPSATIRRLLLRTGLSDLLPIG
ncbi:STAS domain-containing protein [Amycolatopsis keratiniphila]|uniref:STAS domain-containing protein n=1 Tax=Amycolatopsis keratiniphila TaxID=129921 RepID=UPI00087DCF7A|nr:STAS domain-containing protein [Amycolatopsis keratiniphila]SDU10821.1 anti-sigma B factor antagonist [Amycolatopsis keratiniphila]